MLTLYIPYTTSKLERLHDDTHTHITIGRTPLDE